LTCPSCQGAADIFGHHGVKCYKGPGISSRHNAVRDCVVKMHREVGHKIAVEKVVYHDGHSERPGYYYEEESKTCVDVSIVQVKSSASLLNATKI